MEKHRINGHNGRTQAACPQCGGPLALVVDGKVGRAAPPSITGDEYHDNNVHWYFVPGAFWACAGCEYCDEIACRCRFCTEAMR